ncbi:MAG: UDP-2,4-diacetamido-2,4,6-trideoxy-beta-L-altropyranose hydrolase [Odoribacter sp.]
MRKIFFRADAGADIGYGHFIRTLALADMLKNDFECVFVTQSPTEYQRSEVSKICRLVEVPATEEKFGLFLEMLEGDEIVVLDNYFYDTDYQRKIKEKGCKLVCIDDMHDKHYVADVVINHGLTDPLCFDVEPYTQLCLGFEWALLRKPFLEAKPCDERERGHWVVSFGGVDCYDLTLKFAKQLEKFDTVKKITAIVGDGYKDEQQLKTLTKVNVLKKLSAEAIANLFCRVEGAILPASTISMEAIACGCPVISGFFVDNQKEIYQYAINQKRAQGIGNLLEPDMEKLLLQAVIHTENIRIPFFSSDIKERYINQFKRIVL